MNQPADTHFKLNSKQFIPAIVWFLIVLTLICLPGKTLPKSDFLDQLNFDKLVHCGMFGMLAFLFCLPYKNHPDTKVKITWFIKIMITTSVWGLTTELIQKYFIPGRAFEWLDWVADSTGALVGFWTSKRFFLIRPSA